jgi:hypothetical protein
MLLYRFLLLYLLVVAGVGPARGEFRPHTPGEPLVRVILWGPTNARAWVDFDGRRYHVGKGDRLGREWRIEDIRRENILFRRSSNRHFVEIPLAHPPNSRFHRGWSFLGDPIGLWEALELLAKGFGSSAVMHTQAGGPVTPNFHADNLERMLLKCMPAHHRFAQQGSILLVMPVRPGDEDWHTVLQRVQRRRAEELLTRFPSLKKPGNLCARGDDIHLVLRQIALGGKIRITFPKDLHFPVYAAFKNVPFCHILVKIAYLNQCFIIERTEGLELQPWPRHIQPLLLPPVPEMAIAGPEEPQSGWGLAPPPLQPPDLPLHGPSIPLLPDALPYDLDKLPYAPPQDSYDSAHE